MLSWCQFDSFMESNFIHFILFFQWQNRECDLHLRLSSWAGMGKVAFKVQQWPIERKKKVLAKLRAIAKARTEEEYRHRLSDLQDSEEWRTNTNLSNYITKTWLPQHKVYMHTYHHIFLNFLLEKLIFNSFIEMGMGVQKRPLPYNYQHQQWRWKAE